MNKQRFIYLILTISILISFTACNEAKDSVPTDSSVDTTLSEQVTSSTEADSIDLISPSTEETPTSLEYTLPGDDVVIENTSSTEEDTAITTYISSPDENVTTPTPDENVTTPTPDENVTTPTPDENVTTTEEIIIVVEYTTGFVGKLIDSHVSGIDYTCDGKTNKTDYLGQFNCETTPVEFSLGNVLLGSIENITDDYLIFPQDLLGIQRGAALHPDVTKMAILFQSLDNDANPENGIIIKQDVIELINQIVIQGTNIQDITLTELTSILEIVIETNLQNNPASKLQLVATKQAQDHLLTSLSSILVSPIQP